MRKTLLTGLVLAVAAGLMVLVGSALELDLESAALLGGALGAVVALVPDRTPASRLGGFAAGFVVAWLGYVARAALLPDTSGGRAVAVVAVVLICVAISAASRERLTLWSILLGTAAFTGGYEFTYDQAPTELLSTSLSTATTLLFNVAVGFLAASLFAPATPAAEPGPVAAEPTDGADDHGAGRHDSDEHVEPENTDDKTSIDAFMGAGNK